MVIRKYNKLRRRKWARERKSWNFLGWRKHIFSDECKVEVNIIKKTLVWKFEADPGWMYPQERKSKRFLSVMTWGYVTYHGFRKLAMINGTLNNKKYKKILERILRMLSTAFTETSLFSNRTTLPAMFQIQ